MNQTIKSAAAVGAIVLMSISGCDRRGVKTVEIDGHIFHVPQEHLVRGTIPWLPMSQHDGLMFHINPETPLSDRVSVLIQSTAITCGPGESLGSSPLASACHAAARKEVAEQGGELERAYPYGDPTQWEYRVKDQSDMVQGTVVARCSAMGDGNGLCRSFSNYGDLVYTMGLRDSEIERLPTIRRTIHDLLSSWEEPLS